MQTDPLPDSDSRSGTSGTSENGDAPATCSKVDSPLAVCNIRAMANRPTPPPPASAPETRGLPVGGDLPDRKSIVIGRGLDCDVVVKDEKASRRHCQLRRESGAFVLEDLGSKNGTFVNGERISAAVTLKPNQSFTVGNTLFCVAV